MARTTRHIEAQRLVRGRCTVPPATRALIEDRTVSTTERRLRTARRIRAGTARARAWNQRIRAVVHRDISETLPFFCECGSEFCRDSVWLTLREARDLIERGEPIVSDHLVRELDACG